MRAVHATSAVKTAITVPVSNSLPVNGPSAADAFSALVHALGDLSGQTAGSGTGSGSDSNRTANSGVQPQSQSATPSSATPVSDPALTATIAPAAPPAPGSADTKKSKDSDESASDSAASQSASTPATPDPNALALLAMPGVEAAQQPAPPPGTQPSSPGQAPSPAQIGPDGTINPQAAPDAQANGTTAGTGPTDPTAAGQSLPAAQANPTSAPAAPPPVTLSGQRPALNAPSPVRLTGQAPMPAGSGPAGKAAPSVSQPNATRTAASPPGTAPSPDASTQAIQPVAPAHDTGIGPSTETNGLPQAPLHAPNASASTDQGSTQSDAHTGTDSQRGAADASAVQAEPAATTFSSATAVDPSTPAALAVAASRPLALASQPAAQTPPQDPQTLALASRAAALAASAVAQVSVTIQRAGLSSVDSLTVQLDPAELGRVEVKLKMEKGGTVHAAVTADRPQTLDMLRNDKTSLEKALQSAGLSTDTGSLSFNLRNNGNSGQQSWTGGTTKTPIAVTDDASTMTAQLSVVAADSGWTEAGRLDLRV